VASDGTQRRARTARRMLVDGASTRPSLGPRYPDVLVGESARKLTRDV
jgi:hypothetical protein